MKLTVSITRHSDTGILAARVLQSYEGRNGTALSLAGSDLLRGRRFKDPDNAVSRCDEILLAQYKLVEPPEIEYVYAPGVKVEKVSK